MIHTKYPSDFRTDFSLFYNIVAIHFCKRNRFERVYNIINFRDDMDGMSPLDIMYKRGENRETF